MSPLVEQILQQIDGLSPRERAQIFDSLLQTQAPQTQIPTTAELQWEQAVSQINQRDPATIERQKAKIARLIIQLNEDEDIEEQTQSLAIIEAIEPVSI